MLSKKNNKPQPIVREFFDELKDVTWKPITYTLYNKLDEEGFIPFLNNKYKERFSIDDFECGVFDLTEKEKFLISMHNKEYLQNVSSLCKKLDSYDKVKIHIDYDKGIVQVIKLLNVNF